MKAITCKYIGPTGTKGSRIKADDGDGNTYTMPYPHEVGPGVDAFAPAAIGLCLKMGWKYGELIAGGTKNAWVFVFSTSDHYAIEPFEVNI